MNRILSNINKKLSKSQSSTWSKLYSRNMIAKGFKLSMFIVMLIMCNIQDVSATHVVGGELKYRYIGNDRYEITLTFRRDCINGADDAQFDPIANVWIFSGDGNLKTNLGANGRLKMDFNSSDTLNEIIMSDCGFEGTQVCVHETQYKETVRLPFNPGEGGYILAYQRCCRNMTLDNINTAELVGGTWAVEITPEAQELQNNSPDFNQWAPVYVCANEDVNFDHSAIDTDGDSLVYKLCTPYDGATADNPIPQSAPYPPYTPVTWKDPFSIIDLLGGVELQIDSETGLMTGSPNQVGQFLVGVCVEEYRDGVKIGEVRRDFQYNVRICSDPPTALFEANDGDCNGPDVNFDNQSLGATEYIWNFDYPNTDPAFTSTDENPFFQYDNEGVYDVQLIVSRGADSCSDTIIQQVAALFSDIDVMFEVLIQSCNEDGGYSIRLINRSIEAEEGFDIVGAEWEITQNDETTTYVGNIINLTIDPTDFFVSLQTESETGCKKTLVDTISISDFEHVADFVYELESCPEFGVATLAFGDASDAINIYDTPLGYEWTVTNGADVTMFTDSSFTYDVEDTGMITVDLVVDFGGGCSASISKEISLQDVVPQASYELQPQGCPDDGTVDLTFVNTTSTSSPDYPYSSVEWAILVAGETTTGTGESIMVNASKDSLLSIEYTVIFENGCRDIITETYVPGPFATISFEAEPFKICLGDSLTFVVNPNSDFTYTWAPMDGLVFADPDDLSNPMVIGISDTQYAVTVSDGLCEISSVVDIVVLDSDNLSISGDSIVCDGNVSLTASGGIGEGDFEWSLTPDFTDIIFVGNTLETGFSGQSQTYYANFTGESCNDPYAEYTVILSDIYDVVFNGDPVRVCLTDTVALLSNPNPLLTYEWSPLDGIHFLDPMDGSTAHVIGIMDTEYNVTISDDFCTLDTSIAVVIGDAQNFQITGDSIVCDDTVQLIASGASGIGMYEWSLDPDFSTIIHVGDTLNTELTGLSQLYYVQFTDKTCGDLILSYNVRKFVFDLLYAEPYMICPGDTLDYTVFNQGEGPLVFEWLDDVHVVANGNTNMPSIGVGFDETEPFDVIFIATSPSGCERRDTVSFEIMDNPIVDFDFELEECGEYTVCFIIEGTYIGFPSWDFGDPAVTDDVSIDAAPCYTYDMPGVYDVVLSNLTSQCPFEDIVKTVTINDDINIDPIEDQIICLGDLVELTASSPDNNISFLWCNLAGDTLQVGPDFSQSVNQEFELVLKGVDPNGCFDMDTILIGPFVFNIDDNVPEIFCSDENTEIEIFANGTQDGYTFQWGPEDCVLSGGDTPNPILIAQSGKDYTVTVTNIEYGCDTVKVYSISTTSFTVELDAINEFGVNTDTINQGEETTIFVIDPEEGYQYEWSDESTDDELVVSPEETTTYSVTITDDMGCTATDMITIFVRLPKCDETDVFLPSAFTPNGDGVNDILYLRSNFIDQMELLIYNRWGEEVFTTTKQTFGWDGTYKGTKLAPDAYAYTLRVVCINQAEYTTRGNVSLLK